MVPTGQCMARKRGGEVMPSAMASKSRSMIFSPKAPPMPARNERRAKRYDLCNLASGTLGERLGHLDRIGCRLAPGDGRQRDRSVDRATFGVQRAKAPDDVEVVERQAVGIEARMTARARCVAGAVGGLLTLREARKRRAHGLDLRGQAVRKCRVLLAQNRIIDREPTAHDRLLIGA